MTSVISYFFTEMGRVARYSHSLRGIDSTVLRADKHRQQSGLKTQAEIQEMLSFQL